jgi:hypothetical protein
MPVPPTDPRAFARSDLPLPPTMNDSGMLPSTGRIGPAPRFDPVAQAENGGRRSSGQKVFDNYKASPTMSPFLMLDSPTSNGTVNAYTAYVRPAEDQQRANQEFDAEPGNLQNSASPPPPSYPPVFQNYSGYYPGYAAGR